MSKEMNWVDLTAYDIHLIMTKLPNGNKYLVAWGGNEDSQSKLKQLKFISRKGNQNVMYASSEIVGGQLFRDLKELFPDMKLVKRTIQDIVVPDIRQWAMSINSSNEVEARKDFKALTVELSQELLLGQNAKGEKVYNTPHGRIALDSTGERRTMNFKSDPADFLRLPKGSYRALDYFRAVEGYFNSVVEGSILHFEQLKRITATLFNMDDFDAEAEKLADAGASRLFNVENALQKCLVNYASELLANAPDRTDAIQQVQELYERLPVLPHSYRSQLKTSFNGQGQHFEPSPAVASVVLELLSDKMKLGLGGDKSPLVYITNSNGGYIEGMSPRAATVYTHANPDLVPSGIDSFNPALNRNLKIVADSVDSQNPESMDFVVANEDASSLAKTVSYDGVTYKRRDLLNAAKALSVMKEDGGAVIMIKEDGSLDGRVDGEFKAFLEWMYSRFEIGGVAEINGDVFKVDGETANMRIISVDGKLLIPDLDAKPPEKFDILDTSAEVMALPKVWRVDALSQVDSTVESDDQPKQNLSDLLKGANSQFGQKVESNEYQTRYVSGSKLGETFTMAPKNMAGPMRKALAKVLRDHPDIDQFVADNLQMSLAQLSDCFGPEQIDFLALAIWREQNGKDVLLGDATGVGKGRSITGFMRYQLLKGRKLTFVTENKELFTDILRDFADIQSSHLIKPYVVDNNKTLLTPSGQVLDQGSRARNEGILDGTTSLGDSNIFFCTYTQLRDKRVAKAKKLGQVRKTYDVKPSIAGEFMDFVTDKNQVYMVADEIHNAVTNTSSTNSAMERLIGKHVGLLGSSGTSGRHAQNMGFYVSLFPAFKSAEELVSVMARGGDTLSEHVIQMLASDGGYIRREHDFSRAEFSIAKNPRSVDETKELVDAFARVNSVLAVLSKEARTHIFSEDNQDNLKESVEKVGGRLSKSSSMQVGAMHFTSRFSNLQRQFYMAIETPYFVDLIRDSLSANEKPVFSLNNTGASFLKKYDERMRDMAEAVMVDGVQVSDELKARLPKKVEGEWVYPKLPTVQDLVLLALEDVLSVSFSKRNSKSSVSIPLGDLAPTKEASLAIEKAVAEAHKAIRMLPEIPYAPLDIIRMDLEAKGISSGELTGRALRIDKHAEGYVVAKNKKPDRQLVKDQFNSGELDVVIANKAGSTGISMHSDARFADQRKRRMITGEILMNILDQVQMFGRVNRNNQVVDPHYQLPKSGIPAQDFILSNFNNHMRRLSANSTSSRDSQWLMESGVDFLNKVGDGVCYQYLKDNADVSEKMGFTEVDLFNKAGGEKSDRFSQRFAGAIARLSFDEQNEVLREIKIAFDNEVKALEVAEKNPLKPRNYNWEASTLRKTVYQGKERSHYTSDFDLPVYLKEVSYSPKLENTSKVVLERVKNGTSQLTDSIEQKYGTSSVTDAYDTIIERLEKGKVKQYEFHGNTAMYQEYVARVDALRTVLPYIQIGGVIQERDFQNKQDTAVITSFNIDAKNPMDWSFTTTQPGQEYNGFFKLRDILDDMNKPRREGVPGLVEFTGEMFDKNHLLCNEFDTAKSRYKQVDRITLEGNILECARIAAEMGMGTVSSYVDDKGISVPCVLMPKSVSYRDMIDRPIKLLRDDVFKYIDCTVENRRIRPTLRSGKGSFDNTKHMKIGFDGDMVVIETPKNKQFGDFCKSDGYEAFRQQNCPQVEARRSHEEHRFSKFYFEEFIDLFYAYHQDKDDKPLSTCLYGVDYLTSVSDGLYTKDVDEAIESMSFRNESTQPLKTARM
tara:strand:- start:489 stop:5771 length:5283 start_codon:yes stop_codon:yes gene_type:complete